MRSWSRPGSSAALAPVLVATLLAACDPIVSGGITGSIPRCADVPQISAPPDAYRDAPIYVANEMPVGAVMAWAQGQPGYQAIWIDREHNGWVTVAFNRDVAELQRTLADRFPGEGVVAVRVHWTRAELEALQQRVIEEGQPFVQGAGIRENHGVVAVLAGVLTPETVGALQSRFRGERVCLEGIEPADAPPEGPQPQGGEGWRLLADQDEVGSPYRTGIAADPAGYEALWAEIGLLGERPAVDFETEVVVWFGAVHGSSCPRLRLDDVVVEDRVLFAEITQFQLGPCTADAIGHAYVVAIEREKLPQGRFTIQLEGGERPAGVVNEELTIVDADLSVPGAGLTPDQLLSPAPPVDEGPRVGPGGFVEPEVEWRYRLWVHCGIEWLGELNGVTWRTTVPAGDPDFIPPQWRGEIALDGTIDLGITLHVEPEPVIAASAGSHTVTYHPSADPAPGCR